MLVDGKAIAADILKQVAETAAVTSAPNFETRKYLKMKRAKAAAVGVLLNVVELPAAVSTAAAIASVTRLAEQSDGVVVQLPFPAQVDRDELLAAVPVAKDPDGFQYGKVVGACLPPVVGAIDEISQRYHISWQGKRVVVLGEGVLVGRPAAAYAKAKGAMVTVLTKDTYDPAALPTADIVISGIGQPHFITPKLIKEGVVIFDAGTSEDGGMLVGDADVAVASKAKLLTPVPGGIGPITIACLLRNLISLVDNNGSVSSPS